MIKISSWVAVTRFVVFAVSGLHIERNLVIYNPPSVSIVAADNARCSTRKLGDLVASADALYTEVRERYRQTYKLCVLLKEL